MTIFIKSVEEIAIEDVANLVDAKERESISLEYKAKIEGTERHKKELVKDISAFANSEGGYLIIGLEEKDGIPKRICGTLRSIGRQKVEEWIENVLITNISQKVRTKIKVLPISGSSDKVVVIIYVPISSKRPHMVTSQGENKYYKRHQFQVLPADEMEVREMFESAKRHTEELSTFLSDRNLNNEKSENFARSRLVSNLVKPFVADQKELGVSVTREPFSIFGICPRWLGEKVNTASKDFDVWLNSKRNGYYPNKHLDLISPFRRINLDSVESSRWCGGTGKEDWLWYYLEIFRNGYIETGMSSELFGPGTKTDHPQPLLHLTWLIGLFFIFIGFAKEFYQYIKYYDELDILMCLANIDGFILHGFGKKNDKETWVEPYDFFYGGRAPVCSNRNVKIQKTILVSELNENTIKDIAYYFAERVSNAFGERIVKCFDDNRDFNVEGFSGFTRL